MHSLNKTSSKECNRTYQITQTLWDKQILERLEEKLEQIWKWIIWKGLKQEKSLKGIKIYKDLEIIFILKGIRMAIGFQ